MKPFILITSVVFITACTSGSNTNTDNKDSSFHQSIHDLQADMPEDTGLYLQVSSSADIKDSIEKNILKTLQLKSVQQIANLDGKTLHDIYPLFYSKLKSANEDADKDIIAVYRSVFEKMDIQVIKLIDSQQMTIKDELEIARIKSDILTIFNQSHIQR